MSARVRETIVSAILLTALSVTLVIAWSLVQGRQLRAEGESKVTLSTELVVEASQSALAEGNILRLARVADRSVRSRQITRIMITDRNGFVIVDTVRQAYGSRPVLAQRILADGRIRLEQGKDLWTSAMVVRDELGRSLGVVIADFPTTRLRAAQSAARRSGILIALLGIAIGIVLTFFTTRYLTQPLTDLAHAIRRLESGELESPVPVSGPTELVDIGNAFNSMVGAVGERIRNLELLNEMESNLAMSPDVTTSLRVIERASQALLGAASLLWVQDPVSRMLMQISPSDESSVSEPVSPESGLPVAASFSERRTILIGDDCDLPSGTEIVADMPVCSGVVTALSTPEGMSGVLAIVNPRGHRTMHKEDRALARAMAALAAPMIAAAVRARMQSRAVSALQALLIPEVPAELAPSMHAVYLPAEEAAGVGGDYYDLADLGESRWGIVIGDASGKGLEAARYSTMSKWILRSFMHEYENPADVLRQSNRVLAMQGMAERFITVFCCIWDMERSSIVYTNAGHPPPMIFRASSGLIEELPPTGTVLGLVPNATYALDETTLSAGDVICLYTDGISEARHGDEWFGTDMLAVTLRDHAHESCVEIADAIISHAKEFAGGITRDDIALVVLKP